MSEFRQNLATKEWVIIATDRAKRPHDHIIKDKAHLPVVERNPTCPFCPGNESMTPPATQIVGTEKDWTVRVFPNKFAAVGGEGDTERSYDGPYRMMPGVGVHEVIAETPRHDLCIASMPPEHVRTLMRVYHESYRRAWQHPKVAHVILFKNHGLRAGTSIEHPHSQLVAVPLVPGTIRDRMVVAMRYYDDRGECPYCRMLEWELQERERVFIESEHFVTFVLFAAFSPFHTWIMPRRHKAGFDSATPAQLDDLAGVLQQTIRRLHHGLGNPDYNLVIRSYPDDLCGNPYLHWYVSVIPRVTTAAGFELGSGIYINGSVPEESAKFLREVKLPG
jgi:UDPglucose--hexose-1-phosphate uridylyltransferase